MLDVMAEHTRLKIGIVPTPGTAHIMQDADRDGGRIKSGCSYDILALIVGGDTER